MKTPLDELAADPNIAPAFREAVRPVRVVNCPACAGGGWILMCSVAGREFEDRCRMCGGGGKVATDGGEV